VRCALRSHRPTRRTLSPFVGCTKDASELAERLNVAGADLAVMQENVNTRSPIGPFIFTLFSALARLEDWKREQIADRTSSAMVQRQAGGRRMTRPDRCPYSWRSDSANPTASLRTRSKRRSPAFGRNVGAAEVRVRSPGRSTSPESTANKAAGRTRPSAPSSAADQRTVCKATRFLSLDVGRDTERRRVE
jgi:hypothetical protein